MYGALWRRLPGPWPVKTLEAGVLLAGTVALLFVVVFPWAEPRLPFTDVTVDEEGEGADTVDTDNPDGSQSPAATDPAVPTLPGA